MDFDNFCSLFECHSILAEKQRTKQTNYSSLSFFASLDTQDTFQGGTIVEWKKFRQEIPVWLIWIWVKKNQKFSIYLFESQKFGGVRIILVLLIFLVLL